MALTDNLPRSNERKLIVKFLRSSAERIFGIGVYSDEEYDQEAIHWMNEGLELAADSIEKGEHLEPIKE